MFIIPDSTMPTQRYQQLDALRGLAALAVVFHHCLLIPSSFDYSMLAHILMSSPLGIVRAGSEAVNLFFVLSGFVLALQLNDSDMNYSQYLTRRVCRIWIPYICAITFAIILINWTVLSTRVRAHAWSCHPFAGG